MIRAMVVDSYGWFVDLVADRRKLPREDVLRLADGTIFTGRQALAVKLVDTLGGNEAIRAYLRGRGVADDLPIVEWKDKGSSSSFWFAGVAAQILRLAGFGDSLSADTLRNWGTDKLFLDGLVSLWQGGRG